MATTILEMLRSHPLTRELDDEEREYLASLGEPGRLPRATSAHVAEPTEVLEIARAIGTGTNSDPRYAELARHPRAMPRPDSD